MWYWNNRHFSSFIPYSMSSVERNGASFRDSLRRRSEGRRTNCATFLKLAGWKGKGERNERRVGEWRREKRPPRKMRRHDFFARRDLFVPVDFFSPCHFSLHPPYCWKLYACLLVRRRCSSSFILDFSSGLPLWLSVSPHEILHQRFEIEGDIKAWGDLGTRWGSVLNCSESI